VNAFDHLVSIVQRLHLWVMWVVFALFHLLLIVGFLACMWLWQISPVAVSTWVQSVLQLLRLSTVAAILGTLGVTVPLAFYLYLKLWLKLYSSVSVPFLFREITERLHDGS
jgi:hypothetical protein